MNTLTALEIFGPVARAMHSKDGENKAPVCDEKFFRADDVAPLIEAAREWQRARQAECPKHNGGERDAGCHCTKVILDYNVAEIALESALIALGPGGLPSLRKAGA